MPDEQKGRPYWKYGVIGVKDLVEDLTSWNHLFIAGRLQKPVLDLDTQGLAHISSVISDARRQNLRAAAAAAMVILPQDFSELDLYYTICSLSYAGDVRLMLGAENPQKLQSMIYKRPHALQRFRTLFEPILESAQDRGILIRSRKPSNSNVEVKAPVYKYEQDISRKPELIRTYLPERVQDHVFRNANHLDDFSDNMKDYVIRTVRKSSAKQLLNNVLMNNPLKSSKYAFAKLAKGLRR
jgi:translocator assembly and maintenance protein 41